MEYCVSFTSSFHKRNYLKFLAEITTLNYKKLFINILSKSIFINNHLQPHRTNAINAPYNDGKDDSSYQSCLVYRIEFAGK